jgi:osmoprotectant transport system permease protein
MDYIFAHPREVLDVTLQHLMLAFVSISIAGIAGIPIGVFLTRRPRWSRWVLGAANVIQTIPSLALFGFLIPIPFLGGIGASTAIVALILYSLLPIISNTYAGILGVDPSIREAGRGMGMTDRQLLTMVEFPLALGVIMTGVRVAAVISIGVATIAAAIGAGGLGMYIFRGVSMVDNQLILAGAIPAALLALLADFLLGAVQRRLAGGAFSWKTLKAPAVAAAAVAAIGIVAFAMTGRGADRIVIGSKNFTEQTILGELLAQHVERATGYRVDRRFYLGGTLICHSALVAGEIDIYVEYTGTAYTAILKQKPISDAPEVYKRVRTAYASRFGVECAAPLGFNNTFAIMIRGDVGRRLGIRTISDAARHAPRWTAGFGNEFMEREDGYRGLAAAYGLHFAEQPRIMDLGLTYRALAERKVDVIAGDATNGLIQALDLQVLADDRRYFPPYEAVPLVRSEVLERNPKLRQALAALGGTISDDTMRRLNYAADGLHQDTADVVKRFLEVK